MPELVVGAQVLLNATGEHRSVFTTQIVDLDRHRLLDSWRTALVMCSAPGSADKAPLGARRSRSPHWIPPPATAPNRAIIFPNATRVADHFHSVRTANTAIDDVRRQPLPVTGGSG